MSRRSITLKCAAVALLALLWLPVARSQDPALDALAKAGHWKRVRALLQQRQSLLSSNAEKAYWQARVKEAFGDFAGAEPLARQAVSLDASKAPYHDALASICLDQLEKHPGMFRALHLAHDTKSELETALSLDPKDLQAAWTLMEFDAHAPAVAGGSREKASEVAARISQVEAVRGYLAQAELMDLAGAPEKSKMETLLKKAVEAGPRDLRAHLALEHFYRDSIKDYSAAERAAKAAMALAPDRSVGYAELAAIFAHQKTWDQLDELLAQAAKAVPDDLSPSYQAGKTLLLEGHDYDRSERYLRKYLAQEPEGHAPPLAAAHWRLGLVLEKQGKKQEAIEELQSSLRLDPQLLQRARRP